MKPYSEEDLAMVRLGMVLSTLAQSGGEVLAEYWDTLSIDERGDTVSGLLAIQSALLMRLARATGISPVQHLQSIALMAETDFDEAS